MILVSDSLNFATRVVPGATGWVPRSELPAEINPWGNTFFDKPNCFVASEKASPWHSLLLIEFAQGSQYDLLIQLARREGRLPDGVLCLAGSGQKFHGFRNRPWQSLPGNLHLSVLFSPNRPIRWFGPGFLVLAAVSVCQALDHFPELAGKAGIKWVNDILIDGAKVCGVLAHTLSQGDRVTNGILGIGLNVEKTPLIEPTPYVPETTSISRIAPEVTLAAVFEVLQQVLWENYQTLAEDGYGQLLEVYKSRSVVLGSTVSLWNDPRTGQPQKMAQGRVVDIEENLGLRLAGHPQPFTSGRLVIEE